MPLGRIDAETTANIGVIRGGATNVVPGPRGVPRRGAQPQRGETAATVAGDGGCFQAAAEAAGGRAEVDVTRIYSHFSLADDHLVRRAVAAGRRAGISEPVVRPGGGGSDANILNTQGSRRW